MKTKKHIPTVTIAIVAFNEEQNIQECLYSVLNQKQNNFILKKVALYLDGSTDRTFEKSREVNKNIYVYKGRKRLGKSARLNQIYRDVTTEILVQCDADSVLENKNTISHLIKPLLKDVNTKLTSGNAQPIQGETFVENAVNLTVSVYTSLRMKLNNGNNVFSLNGRLLAVKKSLFSSIIIPYSSSANDAYLYFSCLTKANQYKYVHHAIVLYKSPQNVYDQIRQNTRFVSAKNIMRQYFSKELVEKEYHISPFLMIKELGKVFAQFPLMSIYIFAINTYCRIQSRLPKQSVSPFWTIANSTKLVNN